MEYSELLRQLYQASYTRVERDDRLLDVFARETRAKGIELWENWQDQTVSLLRIHLPLSLDGLKLYSLPRQELEVLLYKNKVTSLANYQPVAKGAASLEQLSQR